MGYLKDLDYAVVQQCMHCGMCLPTCPTYVETKAERNSPRGRISLMRAIADGNLEATKQFKDEMYFCLGCLACETACPAGVDYTQLFEKARADAEQTQAPKHPLRRLSRFFLLHALFRRQGVLRFLGRLIYLYRVSGMQGLVRRTVLRIMPERYRWLDAKTPVVQRHFSPELIKTEEKPSAGPARHRVGLLTGCVQDLIYSNVNRDTVDVLLANGCEVVTPHQQGCCGSLHAHNGEYEWAKSYARRLIDQFELGKLDAIITNAAGCGSHLKHFDRLLKDDPDYAAKAKEWSEKVRDISEWLLEIGVAAPTTGVEGKVTYHDACHLCHGQKITAQPREMLAAVPGLEIKPLAESMWCCGSAGIYNLIQPEMAEKLLQRKIDHIAATGAEVVATGNPGCLLQIQNGLKARGMDIEVMHPVSILAKAYRAAR